MSVMNSLSLQKKNDRIRKKGHTSCFQSSFQLLEEENEENLVENDRIRKKGHTSCFQSSFQLLEEENEENLVGPI
ncbi:hypothetical protein Glove_71g193 [Diversispora epigaea]|uniref:Uncharacterized protein n=1 Tax=Diversispora epigaea TaxID=1348612 RepID=A0A397JJC8_9GLOM|nr:hypothetical protein Glove_71g193 [Diversispora epigaea]